VKKVICSKRDARAFTRHSFYVIPTLTLLMGLTLLAPTAYASADNEEDNIDIFVLYNTSFDECAYSGEVVLEVKYHLNTQEVADMVLNGTEDGVNYHQILTVTTEAGRGSRLLKFNAAPCLQAIEVTFE